MTITRVSETAFRVAVDNPEQAQQLRQRLLSQALPGIIDLVPSFRSLLVTFNPDVTDTAILEPLLQRPWHSTARDADESINVAPSNNRCHQIPVRYQGPDLKMVAELTGLTVAQVIERHLAASYRVAMLGFLPGFAYLTGLDPDLRVPRREAPRNRVPVGAVAIADELTAIYPAASAGGWQLIGVTEVQLFNARQSQPSLLLPGDQVRFVRIT